MQWELVDDCMDAGGRAAPGAATESVADCSYQVFEHLLYKIAQAEVEVEGTGL